MDGLLALQKLSVGISQLRVTLLELPIRTERFAIVLKADCGAQEQSQH